MMEYCFSIESADEFKGTMEKIPDYRIREEDVRKFIFKLCRLAVNTVEP